MRGMMDSRLPVHYTRHLLCHCASSKPKNSAQDKNHNKFKDILLPHNYLSLLTHIVLLLVIIQCRWVSPINIVQIPMSVLFSASQQRFIEQKTDVLFISAKGGLGL